MFGTGVLRCRLLLFLGDKLIFEGGLELALLSLLNLKNSSELGFFWHLLIGVCNGFFFALLGFVHRFDVEDQNKDKTLYIYANLGLNLVILF